MSQERTLRSERIFQGKLVGLRVDTVELPSGVQTRREIVEHGACTAVVAIDADGKVVLVRQFRKAVEEALLEIPAGNVESGEEPQDCACRELEEETGFGAEKWQKLGFFYTSPGFCTEGMHVFLATGLRPAWREPDADEIIDVVRVPFDEIVGLIASGEVRDAKSVAGLLMALHVNRG